MSNRIPTLALCAIVVLSFFAGVAALGKSEHVLALVLFANMLAALITLDHLPHDDAHRP